MSDIAIRTNQLGKRYRLGRTTSATTMIESARDTFARLRQLEPDRKREFWALRDVTLEVPRGEVLGLIGRNGAGKSTLLKLLTRITEPTEGTAEIRGRVGALLEVGTGFHPELTGRDNVYLNGAILGMRRNEISARFDEIVEFSGVERFIDTPVKRYSSGMYLRLAFAVAAHLEPDVLLVDEVLAVGDAAFQRKCLGKMDEVARQGRTVVFVSHFMHFIQRLCSSCALIQDGQLRTVGPSAPVIAKYLNSLAEGRETGSAARDRDGPVELIRFFVSDQRGELRTTFDKEESVRVTLEYRVNVPLEGVHVGLWLLTSDSHVVTSSYDTDSEPDLARLREPGFYRSTVEVPGSFLNAGAYGVRLLVFVPNTPTKYVDDSSLFLEVTDEEQAWDHRVGAIVPFFDWSVDYERGT
jgi:lipopolysaccharide transport system ATP-binding protein